MFSSNQKEKSAEVQHNSLSAEQEVINTTETKQVQDVKKSKILDGQYQLLNTIGNGRFAKVKKALDVSTNKFVAVKILKTNQTALSRTSMLESFFQEIKILTQCSHPNIVRIIDASLDGTLIKEEIHSSNSQTHASDSDLNQGNQIRQQNSKKEIDQEDNIIIKRKNKICYCVLKLVRYGELFQFLESTEKFSTLLSKYLFKQLIEGLEYLHSMGVVHRDIKPENLLIDPKGKLVIGDFGFAIDIQDQSRKQDFDIEKPMTVGSQEYNAPELFDNNESNWTYNAAKADVFSAGVTLFLMMTKCPPFRSAHLKDPYFRRLSSQDKKAFWKIFNSLEIEDEFKDLFEKMSERDPKIRLQLQDVKTHKWLLTMKDMNVFDEQIIQQDLDTRNQIVEKIRESLMNDEQARRQLSSQSQSDEDELENCGSAGDEEEQRQRVIDQQDFELTRLKLISEVEALRTRMQRQLRKL
ncbi:protein kinase domain containing protein [Stylonychia lemnae]|uniref:non-specific serine/threonine protein kinase n=1 Tax=Stylonychia lemnae TaxID=5949 RepID=A0A078APV1_STYLE|nr:protein kinase domain containing protein [Stylonychia lemnae]|eukprot:CDW84194.1 protein kinase domain containing protein [Stylonychia lemnae]